MKIENVEVKPMGLSYEPEFHITIEYSYRGISSLPLRFNGYLFLDRHRIAFLTEYEFKNGRSDNLTSMNSSRNTERRDKRIFVAPITRNVLNKLEEKRSKDPKGELKFDLHIQFLFMEPMFEGVKRTVPQNDVVLASLIDNSIFKTVTHDFDHELIISSGDWLYDFSKVFQRSRYQVFEIPLPESLTDTNGLSQRLNAAIVSLKDMEKAKLSGDWESVLKESRPVWELVKNKEEIAQLMRQDELNDETIKAFNMMVESLFNFSSKFIHRESKSKELMMVNKARKEDAELVYVLAVSLINVISKKLTRHQ